MTGRSYCVLLAAGAIGFGSSGRFGHDSGSKTPQAGLEAVAGALRN